MQYLYNQNAKDEQILIVNDDYRYIIKARRHRVGDIIYLRNLQDDYIYKYSIENISRRDAQIRFISKEILVVEASKKLHIGWCIIDNKVVEKNIVYLNEIGVERITFIYCNRSQKSFKVDFDKLNKILINSSSQCGRSKMMKLDITYSLQEFKDSNPNSKMLNFSPNKIRKNSNIDTVVVGCEGGFTNSEVELFEDKDIVGLDSSMILKSQSATIALSSILIL
ncbi:Ribosomal RNA small subunit methyltransferase E [hydrothermal vent metagenome]|uniref:16S rRNA (uracil(1498)-N(3))-methyltransferase n=1 Tax=hydrothermal vent metagenome TaxID=652676 RepID=A0A1W1EIP3_9ZZZZ